MVLLKTSGEETVRNLGLNVKEGTSYNIATFTHTAEGGVVEELECIHSGIPTTHKWDFRIEVVGNGRKLLYFCIMIFVHAEIVKYRDCDQESISLHSGHAHKMLKSVDTDCCHCTLIGHMSGVLLLMHRACGKVGELCQCHFWPQRHTGSWSSSTEHQY